MEMKLCKTKGALFSVISNFSIFEVLLFLQCAVYTYAKNQLGMQGHVQYDLGECKCTCQRFKTKEFSAKNNYHVEKAWL